VEADDTITVLRTKIEAHPDFRADWAAPTLESSGPPCGEPRAVPEQLTTIGIPNSDYPLEHMVPCALTGDDYSESTSSLAGIALQAADTLRGNIASFEVCSAVEAYDAAPVTSVLSTADSLNAEEMQQRHADQVAYIASVNAQRLKLKREIKHWVDVFISQHGAEPTSEQKEPIRHMYEAYSNRIKEKQEAEEVLAVIKRQLAPRGDDAAGELTIGEGAWQRRILTATASGEEVVDAVPVSQTCYTSNSEIIDNRIPAPVTSTKDVVLLTPFLTSPDFLSIPQTEPRCDPVNAIVDVPLAVHYAALDLPNDCSVSGRDALRTDGSQQVVILSTESPVKSLSTEIASSIDVAATEPLPPLLDVGTSTGNTIDSFRIEEAGAVEVADNYAVTLSASPGNNPSTGNDSYERGVDDFEEQSGPLAKRESSGAADVSGRPLSVPKPHVVVDCARLSTTTGEDEQQWKEINSSTCCSPVEATVPVATDLSTGPTTAAFHEIPSAPQALTEMLIAHETQNLVPTLRIASGDEVACVDNAVQDEHGSFVARSSEGPTHIIFDERGFDSVNTDFQFDEPNKGTSATICDTEERESPAPFSSLSDSQIAFTVTAGSTVEMVPMRSEKVSGDDNIQVSIVQDTIDAATIPMVANEITVLENSINVARGIPMRSEESSGESNMQVSAVRDAVDAAIIPIVASEITELESSINVTRAERVLTKRAIRNWIDNFIQENGRAPSSEDKESVRHLYIAHIKVTKTLDRLINRLDTILPASEADVSARGSYRRKNCKLTVCFFRLKIV
jgi:hypothetical protein